MADYPTLGQAYSSTRKALSNVKTEAAADGTVRAQDFHSKIIYQFDIVHPFLTNAEQASIQAFYDANKAISFTFNRAADGLDYTLIFLGEPDFNKVTHNNWTVVTKSMGTRL